jgi:hypothetical protein
MVSTTVKNRSDTLIFVERGYRDGILSGVMIKDLGIHQMMNYIYKTEEIMQSAISGYHLSGEQNFLDIIY